MPRGGAVTVATTTTHGPICHLSLDSPVAICHSTRGFTMSQVIWKYDCPEPGKISSIEMGVDAKIIRVDRGHMWIIRPMPPTITYMRHFVTVGTGQPFPDHFIYRGTWLDGVYVWHLMETHSVDDV